MARMKSCRACGGMVAKNAIGCPWCGRGNPSPGILRRAVNLVVFSAIVGGVILVAVANSASGY